MSHRTRSTVSVEYVQQLLQRMIDNSDHWSLPHEYMLQGRTASPAEAVRLAMASTLSDILMETGNYHGFNYDAWTNGGWQQWRQDGEPYPNTAYLGDQTKVTFYKANNPKNDRTCPKSLKFMVGGSN